MEEVFNSASLSNIETSVNKLIELGISLGTRLILAIIVFAIGRWIVIRLKNVFAKILEKRQVDLSLATFLKSLVNITLTLFLVITVIGVLGIETSSFIALFASAGVAVGVALSGTLQNFAGGVMILLFKPFKVGDYIEAQGESGTVREIQIFNTILSTGDNKVIILPNGGLSTSKLTNYSKEAKRRVDWTFALTYGDDYNEVKTVIENFLNAEPRVMKNPPYFIALAALETNYVRITVRAWVKASDYWPVFYKMNEKFYRCYGEGGLNKPYPQMNVHINEIKKVE